MIRQYSTRRPGRTRAIQFFVGIIGILAFWFPSLALSLTASSVNSIQWHVSGRQFRFSLAASVAGQHGDMTYTIQGPEDGGWKSELEWPLESVFYGGGIFSATFRERFHLNAGVWKSLNEGSGTMKDRDWFDDLRPVLLAVYGDDTAIYGEFESTFDALKFDTNLRFDLLRQPTTAMGLIAGYRYALSKWATSDGYQRSPIPSFDVGSVIGPGITYEQTITIPYLGVAGSLTPNTNLIAVNFYALYSPLAQCEDVDDHIVRKKESTGLTKGSFFSLGSDVHFRFSNSWSVIGTVNYAKYNLEGSQDQVFYGGSNAGTRFYDIDMTVTGSQTSIGFLISYTLF